MGLRDLPFEILIRICSYLRGSTCRERPNKDIKAVRLASRELAAAGVLSLINCMPFAPYDPCLDTLLTISRDNTLRHYVRELSCDDSHLPVDVVHKWKKTWNASISRMFKNDPKAMAEGQRIYQRILNAAYDIKEEGKDLDVLCLALPKFPNLRKITISDGINGAPFTQQFLRATSWFPKGDMPGPQLWDEDPNLGRLWMRHETPYPSFMTVFRALSKTNHEIHNLVVEGQVCGISSDVLDMLGEFSSLFEDAINVFRHLRSVRLALDTNPPYSQWATKSIKGNFLGPCLAIVRSLESITLISKDGTREINGCLCILELWDVFGSTKWPLLQYFELGEWMISADELFKVLEVHSETLKLVVLRQLLLSDSLWEIFFDHVRDAFTVAWTHVKFTALEDRDRAPFDIASVEVLGFLRDGAEKPVYRQCYNPDAEDDKGSEASE